MINVPLYACLTPFDNHSDAFLMKENFDSDISVRIEVKATIELHVLEGMDAQFLGSLTVFLRSSMKRVSSGWMVACLITSS